MKAAETWILILSCLVEEAWTRRLPQVVSQASYHRSATDKVRHWVTEGQQCALLQGSGWNYKNAMFPNVLATLHSHYCLVFYKYQALNNKEDSTSPTCPKMTESTCIDILKNPLWAAGAYPENGSPEERIATSYARAVTLARHVNMSVEDITKLTPKFWKFHRDRELLLQRIYQYLG